jgi:DNA-binding transcriptional MerR regulator/methylmalonyl-CoA mutase cobalamin-binding subunit
MATPADPLWEISQPFERPERPEPAVASFLPVTEMKDRTRIVPVALSISAVERDTGLSKDTLRVWERRYGFPSPARDAMDERAYATDQVEKLRVIKRLLDAGHRPGVIVALPYAELLALSTAIHESPSQEAESVAARVDLQIYIGIIRQHDAPALRAALTRALSRGGVADFVTRVLGPLNSAVGEAWMRGQLEIFEEHLYTEVVQVVLRQAIAGIPEPRTQAHPRVLLTTFPGEPHGLGLLMAEAMLAMEGCACMSLGVQTPLWDTALAAQAHRSDIVALSFTGCMNPNQVVDGLTELRQKLPPHVRIWAGGSAPVLFRRRVEGVEPLGSLDAVTHGVRQWREAAAVTAATAAATAAASASGSGGLA